MLTLSCLRWRRRRYVVTNAERCHRFSSLQTSVIDFYKKRVLSMTLSPMCTACMRKVSLLCWLQAVSVSHADTTGFRRPLWVRVNVSKRSTPARRAKAAEGDIGCRSIIIELKTSARLTWVPKDRFYSRRCRRLILTPCPWRANEGRVVVSKKRDLITCQVRRPHALQWLKDEYWK